MHPKQSVPSERVVETDAWLSPKVSHNAPHFPYLSCLLHIWQGNKDVILSTCNEPRTRPWTPPVALGQGNLAQGCRKQSPPNVALQGKSQTALGVWTKTPQLTSDPPQFLDSSPDSWLPMTPPLTPGFLWTQFLDFTYYVTFPNYPGPGP